MAYSGSWAARRALGGRNDVGRKAQAAGKLFERFLADRLEALQEARIVAYFQHSEPAWAKKGDVFIRTEASGADFYGTLASGQSFAIECKSVAPGERLSHRGAFFHQSGPSKGKKKRQLIHLEAMPGGTTYALLAVEFRHADSTSGRYLVPWGLVRWATLSSALTLGEEDCSGWELSVGLFDGLD